MFNRSPEKMEAAGSVQVPRSVKEVLEVVGPMGSYVLSEPREAEQPRDRLSSKRRVLRYSACQRAAKGAARCLVDPLLQRLDFASELGRKTREIIAVDLDAALLHPGEHRDERLRRQLRVRDERLEAHRSHRAVLRRPDRDVLRGGRARLPRQERARAPGDAPASAQHGFVMPVPVAACAATVLEDVT